MADLGPPDGVPKYLILDLSIRNREAVVLPFVFGPGTDQESFEVEAWGFGIIVNAPACRPVAPANSLILINCLQEIPRFVGSHFVFHRDEHRPRVGLRL